jgi:hypothetical protein
MVVHSSARFFSSPKPTFFLFFFYPFPHFPPQPLEIHVRQVASSAREDVAASLALLTMETARCVARRAARAETRAEARWIAEKRGLEAKLQAARDEAQQARAAAELAARNAQQYLAQAQALKAQQELGAERQRAGRNSQDSAQQSSLQRQNPRQLAPPPSNDPLSLSVGMGSLSPNGVGAAAAAAAAAAAPGAQSAAAGKAPAPAPQQQQPKEWSNVAQRKRGSVFNPGLAPVKRARGAKLL